MTSDGFQGEFNQRLTGEERRAEFFFAEQAAGMYDMTADLVIPYYSLMHKTLFEVLELTLDADINAEAEPKHSILDIGIGTGYQSLRILEAFPHVRVVGVDFSAPMLGILRGNARVHDNGEDLLRRCTLVQEDFLGEACEPQRLKSYLVPEQRNQGFVSVISALTLHHFDVAEKRVAYHRIYELLPVGGIFINADLFTYSDDALADHAMEASLKWIYEGFKGERAREYSLRKRMDLYPRWVEHYREYNKPLSISNANAGDLKLLHDAGFKTVEVPFRMWQLGVLCARK